MTSVRPISDTEFDAVVLGAELPVIVDFTAAWCGPCKQLTPVLAEVAAHYAGQVLTVSIDADSSPDTVARYGVLSLPSLFAFSGGELVSAHVGAQPKRALMEIFESALAHPDAEAAQS